MKTLFVDTNILLSFYHLTSEDLEELRKLVALIDNGKITLVLTDQVKNEFKRNRASKIADAMKKLQDAKFTISFPAFAKDYLEYSELRILLVDAGKKHSKLVEIITEDAEAEILKADELVASLFKKSKMVSVTDEIYLEALKRVRLGNPPGKEASLGDAVNWECLLASAADFEDVHLVSEDKDFRSQLSSKFNEYLAEEWSRRKSSDILFYNKISDFFKAHFPHVKIASEIERDLLIEELRGSWTFANTHSVIARLRGHTDFSPAQIEALVAVAIENNQVGWIIGDADLHDFYGTLLKHKASLPPHVGDSLETLVEQGAPEDDVQF
jgi:predicted nucleic acid-binding protein